LWGFEGSRGSVEGVHDDVLMKYLKNKKTYNL
jgi:hypothetical protein